MKKCTVCLAQKEKSEFHKDKSRKDGLRDKCKECQKLFRAKYYLKNSEALKSYSREWYENNKEYAFESMRAYRDANQEKNKKRKREYYLKNKDSISRKQTIYMRNKCRSDPTFRLKQRCRKRIWAAFKENGYTKRSKSFSIIGCSKEFLVSHIEAQFKDGMEWDNYGKWHVDHIIPLSSAETEDDVIRLCHYTNLQPLWAKDNLKKGASLDYSPD